MVKVFIDGSAGTTGLKIHERLAARRDISIIQLSEENRKDVQARKEALALADIAFLCLPDNAAIEAVSFARKTDTAIIDTSTAHRVSEDWTYGFPELSGQRQKIALSKRIANPGCHASGFIALIRPLTELGALPSNTPLSCFSLTGYTGGGKKMIAEYESDDRDLLLNAPRAYGLTQSHKHLPEMSKLCELDITPIFCPIVASFPRGMEVSIPIFSEMLNVPVCKLRELYKDYYRDGLVRYADTPDENGFLSASAFAGRDDMQITVTGNSERAVLTARFDNLGKGASGAAIQNMNILLGTDEKTGLNV